MFYFIACFPFILILRDFLFFFAALAPVKGAIWRAWGIESFCLLINKHSRSSKKKKKNQLSLSCFPPIFLYPHLEDFPSFLGQGLCRPVHDWQKNSSHFYSFTFKSFRQSHQCEWNVPVCLCCCYLESNGLGRLLSLFAFTVLIAFVFICTGQEFSITRRVRNALYYLFTHYWWKLRLEKVGLNNQTIRKNIRKAVSTSSRAVCATGTWNGRVLGTRVLSALHRHPQPLAPGHSESWIITNEWPASERAVKAVSYLQYPFLCNDFHINSLYTHTDSRYITNNWYIYFIGKKRKKWILA